MGGDAKAMLSEKAGGGFKGEKSSQQRHKCLEQQNICAERWVVWFGGDHSYVFQT